VGHSWRVLAGEGGVCEAAAESLEGSELLVVEDVEGAGDLDGMASADGALALAPAAGEGEEDATAVGGVRLPSDEAPLDQAIHHPRECGLAEEYLTVELAESEGVWGFRQCVENVVLAERDLGPEVAGGEAAQETQVRNEERLPRVVGESAPASLPRRGLSPDEG
jgi:hypothetical protein